MATHGRHRFAAPPSARSAIRPALKRPSLDAAEAILREHGLSGFSIEAVARRAQAGKPTIYRWWPNRTALLLADLCRARRTSARTSTPAPRRRLASLSSSACSPSGATTAAGRIFRSILAEAQSDPRRPPRPCATMRPSRRSHDGADLSSGRRQRGRACRGRRLADRRRRMMIAAFRPGRRLLTGQLDGRVAKSFAPSSASSRCSARRLVAAAWPHRRSGRRILGLLCLGSRRRSAHSPPPSAPRRECRWHAVLAARRPNRRTSEHQPAAAAAADDLLEAAGRALALLLELDDVPAELALHRLGDLARLGRARRRRPRTACTIMPLPKKPRSPPFCWPERIDRLFLGQLLERLAARRARP